MGLADRPDKARGTNARWPEGLKDRMMTPEVAEEAMHASAEETNRFNRERRANSEGWRTELVKVEKAITAMISAIEEGLYQPSMKARMDELERQKADLMAWLAGVPADVPDILPNVSAVYRKKVERLVAALNEPKDRSEAAEAIRGLIEKIALRPGPARGEIDATLHGDLGTILSWIEAQAIGTKGKTDIPSAEAAGMSVSVVAGARNYRDRHSLVVAI